MSRNTQHIKHMIKRMVINFVKIHHSIHCKFYIKPVMQQYSGSHCNWKTQHLPAPPLGVNPRDYGERPHDAPPLVVTPGPSALQDQEGRGTALCNISLQLLQNPSTYVADSWSETPASATSMQSTFSNSVSTISTGVSSSLESTTSKRAFRPPGVRFQSAAVSRRGC